MSDDDYFSPEAMAARTVSEGDEPVAEQTTVEEPAENTEQVDTAADSGAADGDGEADAPNDDPVAAEPDPYEVRYQEAQKVIGRQGQELGELRKIVESLAAQQQVEPEPQPVFQSRQPTSPQELLEMAAGGDEAEQAYYFARDYAPEYVADVIAEVQAYDPAYAKRMEMDYYQHQIEQRYTPLQQQMTQAQLAQQQAAAVQQITSSIDGFEQVRDQVAQIVESDPWLMGDGSPEAIDRGLRAAVRMVHAQAAQATAQVQQVQQHQSQQMRQQAAVESGTPAVAPPPFDEDPAVSIRNAIFAQDKQRRDVLNGL